MIAVREIAAEETHPLRHTVLWPHLNSTEECFIDVDQQKGAFHLGAFYNNSIVSIGSFFPEKNTELPGETHYRLRAMATDPEVRGMGAGRALIEKAEEKLKEMSVDLLWCDARKVALDFYTKLGFKIKGDWYDKPNIGPHKLMYKRIELPLKYKL
ncbi:GNAT family N-acetyltransferase [Halocola ammonii]